MKQTALTELIQYFRENHNKLSYDILLHKLIDKITQLQTLEREQIVKAYEQRAIDYEEGYLITGEEYYDKNFV